MYEPTSIGSSSRQHDIIARNEHVVVVLKTNGFAYPDRLVISSQCTCLAGCVENESPRLGERMRHSDFRTRLRMCPRQKGRLALRRTRMYEYEFLVVAARLFDGAPCNLARMRVVLP